VQTFGDVRRWLDDGHLDVLTRLSALLAHLGVLLVRVGLPGFHVMRAALAIAEVPGR
jgi:hypothetical protein